MKHKETFSQLFVKYLNRETDNDETDRLLRYFDTDEGGKHLDALVNLHFDDPNEVPAELSERLTALTDRVAIRLNRLIEKPKPIRRLHPAIIAVAAMIIVALGLFFFLPKPTSTTNTTANIDALPGSNRASITYSDGRVLALDSTQALALLPTSQLTYSNGKLLDKIRSGQFATVSTPRGGEYSVILPDGTLVTLNAASTLKFPSTFDGADQRMVELTGEGYFKVAKNPKQPFIVKTQRQQVEVLGTVFNINSYDDFGKTVTTLQEGSVQVTAAGGKKILKPGQKALIDGSGGIQVAEADLEAAMSWTDGGMVFKSMRLDEIMPQISRWYDVEVIYEGQVRSRVFTGGISRKSKLSALLKIFEDGGITCELRNTPQGRTLLLTE